MKRIIYLIVPLIAISLLSSCGCSKSEPTYTITFKNNGDEDKKIENIKAGSIVTENIPTPTDKEGYTFIGWCVDTESKNVFDFNKIKIYEDYTLYSGWKENEPTTYTVKWVNEDGTVLQTDEVEDGNMPPEYQKAIPTKKSDAFNDYEFDGFLPERSEVHSNQVYVAHYVTHTYPNTKVYMSVDIKNDGETFEFDSKASSGLTVDWGDGQKSEDIELLTISHEYQNAGKYDIRIFGEINEVDLRDNTAIKDVYLGDTITTIPNLAFTRSSLQSITFSEDSHFNQIGQAAFQSCNNLVSITIPSSVTIIIGFSFVDCFNLQSVIIPEDSQLTTIGEYTFCGDSELTSINIPSSVTSIGEMAFGGCFSLQSVIIPDDSELTTIISRAFSVCTSLTSITIPSSVTTIGNSAFDGCRKLQSVDLTSYNTDSTIPTLGENVFDGCSSELKFHVASREMAKKFINSGKGWPTDINKYSWLLEECTWAEINEISKSGKANEFFNIGDTKKVQLKHQDTNKDGTDKISEGETYQTVRIIGFNHDYTDVEHPDESKVGITFEFADTIIGFKTYWNNKQKEDSTSYDFINNSDLNDCLQPAKGEKPDGEIYKMMPSDLMSVIKTVNKTVDIHPNDIWEEGNYYTQLFPFSKDEIDSNSDSTYEYYKVDTVNRRIKSEYYWLRTPSTGVWNYRALYVSADGGFGDVGVFAYERAVAPAFCV